MAHEISAHVELDNSSCCEQNNAKMSCLRGVYVHAQHREQVQTALLGNFFLLLKDAKVLSIMHVKAWTSWYTESQRRRQSAQLPPSTVVFGA